MSSEPVRTQRWGIEKIPDLVENGTAIVQSVKISVHQLALSVTSRATHRLRVAAVVSISAAVVTGDNHISERCQETSNHSIRL